MSSPHLNSIPRSPLLLSRFQELNPATINRSMWQRFSLRSLLTLIAFSVSFGSLAICYAEDDEARALELDKAAKVAYKEGDLTKAAALYTEAITYVQHPVLYNSLGRIQLERGQAKDAYTSCSKALASPYLTPEAQEKATLCVEEATIQMNQIRANIESNPSGAKVRLDGQGVGNTPWRGILTPGRRQVDITLENHHTETRVFNASPGQRVNLKVRLIPKGLGGLFTIRTVPENSNILIDGEFIGKSPIEAFMLSSGAHTLQVISVGYLPELRQIYIKEGQPTEQMIYLNPQRGRMSATDLWPAWSLMSAGVLTGLIGGVLGYQALDARDQADLLAKSDGTRSGQVKYNAFVSDMENSRSTSDALWITSAVLVTTGLTWWMISW
jgi:hypothetical protein